MYLIGKLHDEGILFSWWLGQKNWGQMGWIGCPILQGTYAVQIRIFGAFAQIHRVCKTATSYSLYPKE